MPMPTPTHAPSRSHLAGEFVMQRNEDFLEAVVAACGAVAYADGWVTGEERRRLLGALRASKVLSVFPVEEVTQLFDEITARFEEDHDAAEQEALQRVEPFRARRRQARDIIQACCAVAAADSQMDGEERAIVLRLCDRLGFDPADFGLTDQRTRPGRPLGS